jgi:hypothetical protein
MEEAMRQTFSAPMGRATIQMTLFASVILLFVGSLQLGLGLGLKTTRLAKRSLVALGTAILLCLPASMLLKVRNYEITPTHLIVRFGLSNRSFSISEISSIISRPNALSGGRRDFGNGGLWSFVGEFSHPEFGEMRAYVSDLQRTVVIKLPDLAVVISPDDPAAFVQKLQAQRGEVQG